MTYDLPLLEAPALLNEGEVDTDGLLAALTPHERAQVRGFAGQIDTRDPAGIATYGAAEQGAMQTWLDVAIKAVADQGACQGGQGADKLIACLRGFDRLCAPGRFLRWRTRFSRLRREYRALEPAVEATAGKLLDQSVGLRRISKVLERMEQENRAHMARLGAYLLCGQVRLRELRAPVSEAPGEVGAAGIAGEQEASRLERRLHDIALTRQVALQTRAQLALLLDGNARMIDTMERTLRQTLPLWKSQVLIALGLSAQAEARDNAARARHMLERDMRARNSLLGRLLAALRGGQDGRDALRRNNAELLSAVTEMQRALREQQAQSERTQVALRAPAAEMRG